MTQPPLLRIVLTRFQSFFQEESSSGIVLLVCSVAALAWANSPWAGTYTAFWDTPLSIGAGHWQLALDLRHWINDGLMTLFFFVVGLEIKRELLVGELSTARKAALPLLGALGGMVFAGTLYALFNAGTPQLRGWGIPVATDIAFALAVLALLGRRVPLGLKVFLAALAIADDLGAVIVIAIFYSSQLNWLMLGLAGLGLAACALLNWRGVSSLTPYIVLGVLVWLAMLQSGVHATVAGVLLAFCIPARAKIDPEEFADEAAGLIERFRTVAPIAPHERELRTPLHSQQADLICALKESSEKVMLPLERLERGLHGTVAYVIMPLFALANAGVTFKLAGIGTALVAPVGLGIALGKLVGKQVGVTLFCWLAVKFKLAALPDGATWLRMYGIAWLCGIGFTMSLFVNDLCFSGQPATLDMAKISIIVASVVAGAVGYWVLRWTLPPPAPSDGSGGEAAAPAG
jgi:NhaA family Na+:H+ antiporter